jgi:hypothetical protein
MDTAYYIAMGLMVATALLVIIKMTVNRAKGRDELEGLFIFKNRKKGKK